MPEPTWPCAYVVDKTTVGNNIAFIVRPVPVCKRNVPLVLDGVEHLAATDPALLVRAGAEELVPADGPGAALP